MSRLASSLSSFEFFVAQRYLRSKRKEKTISVITVISICGVAAGVMALIVALAINNGFRATLQSNLLGATSHVIVLEKDPHQGITEWPRLLTVLGRLPHVRTANAALYGQVLLSGPLQSNAATIKGVSLQDGAEVPDVLRNLKEGSLEPLRKAGSRPGIVLGSRLARTLGMRTGAILRVISPQGELTPFGPQVTVFHYRVAGIFETGFNELDTQWAFTSLPSAQSILAVGNTVNAVELMLDNPDSATQVAAAAQPLLGTELGATTWMEQNRSILNALNTEKRVTAITIGLIQLVAALNILVTLTMLVMEKYRGIALMLAMGARREQIRNIFLLQGLLLGVCGTALGLFTGHIVCYLADHYRWLRLDADIYALSFVPFQAKWTDSVWIAITAIAISLAATLYPARNATKIAPVEVLRYE